MSKDNSVYNYINSVANQAKKYIDDLKVRVTDLESRVNITETYYGEVFFTNGQGLSFNQILADPTSNAFIEALVAGRPYTYAGWTDTAPNPDVYYSGGTYPGRTDAGGRYPISLPLPIGSSATLVADQYSDGNGMHCDVYMLIKNESSTWDYWLVESNTIRRYMELN